MSDLSSMSDADLLRAYAATKAGAGEQVPPAARMSNEDLMAAYNKANPNTAQPWDVEPGAVAADYGDARRSGGKIGAVAGAGLLAAPAAGVGLATGSPAVVALAKAMVKHMMTGAGAGGAYYGLGKLFGGQ